MNTMKTIKRLLPAVIIVLAAQGLFAQTAGRKAKAGLKSLLSDSTLPRAKMDSLGLLKGVMSAVDYLEKREQFFYPRSRREDPFDLPFKISRDPCPIMSFEYSCQIFGSKRPDRKMEFHLGDSTGSRYRTKGE